MKKSIKKTVGHLLFVSGNILSLYLGLWTFFLGQIAKCITLYLKFFVGEAVAFSVFWTVNMIIKNYF